MIAGALLVVVALAGGDAAAQSRELGRKAPYVQLARDTSQNAVTGKITDVTWEREIEDTHGMWSSGADITIRHAGVYSITTRVVLSPSAGGSYRLGYITAAGIHRAGQNAPFSATDWSNVTMSRVVRLAVGDVVKIQVEHNAGATLKVGGAPAPFEPTNVVVYKLGE